ncbi:MAG TPA: hypothetical protein VNH84_09830, partial [Candidatus Saccharimonadales bacterium]|nr:hypothetical protein [Candidatus Saccharimonadales bacterium]
MKRIRLLVWCTGLGGLLAPAFPGGAAETIWQPAQAPLMTRWAKEVARGKVHTEYPRPQMVR